MKTCRHRELVLCAIALLVLALLGGDSSAQAMQKASSWKNNSDALMLLAQAKAEDKDPRNVDTAGPSALKPHTTGELMITYCLNVLGKVEFCGCKHKKVKQGSVTRRSSYLQQLKVLGQQQLLLDGGSSFFDSRLVKAKGNEKPQAIEKAKVLIESMNRMGYHAMAVGHYDFVLGMDVLKDLEKRAKFPLLCANLIEKDSGNLAFKPTLELEINGVKVGILGLTLSNLQDYYMKRRAANYKVTDGIEAAQKFIPELRKRNDVVIVLSHNMHTYNTRLAKEVPGIDFIIDPFIKVGTHHLWLEKADLLETVGNTLIARIDAQGARLGHINIQSFKNGGPFIDRKANKILPGKNSYEFNRVAIEPHFNEDPEITNLVNAWKKNANKFVDTAKLPPLPLKDNYLTVSTCKNCHTEQYDFWKKTKHSVAFASLEANNDQWRQDCIACHVLGYGQAFIASKDAEPYKNVQCESCHGLNPKHPANPQANKWPRIREKACLTCHNKRQIGTDFNFPEMRSKVACPKMRR